MCSVTVRNILAKMRMIDFAKEVFVKEEHFHHFEVAACLLTDMKKRLLSFSTVNYPGQIETISNCTFLCHTFSHTANTTQLGSF